MREEGNIDINSEKELSKSRFLVNILQEPSLRHISERKEIRYVSIELNENKFIGFDKLTSEDWHDWNKKENRNQWLDISEEDKQEILNSIYSIFYDNETITINKDNFLYPYVRDYIIFKLIRMRHYSVYDEFNDCFASINIEVEYSDFPITRNKYSIKNKGKLKSYFKAINQDSSHNTDKLRQALFFLKYLYLDESDLYKKDSPLMSIDDLYKKIDQPFQKSKEPYQFLDEAKTMKIEHKFFIKESLPSIFKVNYFFEKEYSENNFNNFSSGEKQKIFSIHSVIYHLRNLKSVKAIHEREDDKNDKKLIYYDNVNIIFDEIELYAHPDFQRKFIDDLLKALYSIENLTQNINLLFITHSPFILSDIPKQNVLFLEVENGKSKPSSYKGDNTFGENIHQMLTDGFFISDTKGAFVKDKIQKFLNYYEKTKDEDNKPDNFDIQIKWYDKFIALIGEDYIRAVLYNHLDELKVRFGDKTYLDAEEERLNTRLKEIQKLKQQTQ